MGQERSFRRKLMPMILLSAAVPLVILSVMSIVSLQDTLVSRYQEQVRSDLEQSARTLDITLDKYSSILQDTCTDEAFAEQVSSVRQSGSAKGAAREEIIKKLEHICRQTEGVQGMTLFVSTGEVIFYDNLSRSPEETDWISGKLYREAEGEAPSYQVSAVPVMHRGTPRYMFHISCGIREKDRQTAGTLVMSLEEEILRDTIDNGEQAKTYISAAGQVISSSDPEEIGRALEEIETENFYMQTRSQEDTGWKLTEMYSLDIYRRTLREQILFELLIAAAIMVLLTGVSYLVSRPLVQAVRKIVTGMSRAREGDFSVRIEENRKSPYELNHIAAGFNDMVEQIDVLIRQVRESAQEQRNAELQALEAQIDPHFLYNTLDVINWKALEKGELEISEMLGALADILRYSVINNGEESSIKEELYWLRQYIRLQQEKLGREVRVDMDVSGEILQMRIHKLLFQPFVENSIRHGFRGKEGECRIGIRMEREGDLLHIALEDNGRGMSEEQMRRLEEEGEPGDHVGIANVRKRLRLYYSQRAFLRFESTPGTGTSVHMYIPAEEAVEHEDCDSRR